jgi:hypothetical protein
MMVVLLLLLGFIAIATGMFGLGLGGPVRDTTFGAAVLVSSSVAITGGLVLVGLAAAVSELRRMVQAVMRLRLPERGEAERGQGGRRMEPRIGAPGALDADAADVIPTRFDTPEAIERSRKPLHEEQPPSDAGKARGRTVPPSTFQPAAGAGVGPRRMPAAPAETFDTIRPSDYRKPDTPAAEAPEQRTEGLAGRIAGEVKSPPLSPDAAAPAAIRPARVLKSGTINDVSYTLFSDGSIETQTPDGTLHFRSIDAFRQHLEKSAG